MQLSAVGSRRKSSALKSPRYGATVLGRSAATGRLVLSPASKSGSVTLKMVRAAIENLRNGHK